MDTLILPLSAKKTRLTRTGINLSLALSFLIISQSILHNPPLFAIETKLASNNVSAPLLEKSELNNHMMKELNTQEKSRRYDEETKKKYINGIIYDIVPGVKHIKITKTYQGRTVKINVVEINKNINPDLEITPTLASEKLSAKSNISTIAKKQNSIVAINGTFFKPQTGVPLGTLMIDKKLYTGPIYNRVAMGFFDNGYNMARIQLNTELKSGNISLKVDNVNQPRMLSTYVLVYTPEWGAYAPPAPQYGKQIAVENNKIIEISSSALAIPKDGFVVVGPEEKLKAFEQSKKLELNVGTTPEWKDVNHIISGGPYLVKNGEVYVDMTEQKLGAIGGRNPRSAIGYTEDGNLILAAVDGREETSAGMTLNELASFMKSVGCTAAMNLDGGGSTVMYVNGNIVNRPNVKGGIAISNALTISKKS